MLLFELQPRRPGDSIQPKGAVLDLLVVGVVLLGLAVLVLVNVL